jgi:hypothetical protein
MCVNLNIQLTTICCEPLTTKASEFNFSRCQFFVTHFIYQFVGAASIIITSFSELKYPLTAACKLPRFNF